MPKHDGSDPDVLAEALEKYESGEGSGEYEEKMRIFYDGMNSVVCQDFKIFRVNVVCLLERLV